MKANNLNLPPTFFIFSAHGLPFHSFVISCRYSMEIPANLSPSEFRAYIVGPFVRGGGNFEPPPTHPRRRARGAWRLTPFLIFVAIALAGILSGIFLFALSLLLFHILLQRRRAKAKAKAKARPHGASPSPSPPALLVAHQALSWSSFFSSFPFSSRRRNNRARSRSRSDSESDIASVEGEKKNGSRRRASSLYLEPNQPLYVDVDIDVESETNDRGPHPGMQFILTPPTPGR